MEKSIFKKRVDPYGLKVVIEDCPFKLKTSTIKDFNKESELYKKSYSMVFRQINSNISLKDLREKNYQRMKHFH